ncbi:uncharacterized protein [Atheta coriaria]|uniref:uncharacterized protein isoform X2 n=1 Tax=Dalotia coriaria TaxID=877792 RepID=UPI0031F43412
MDCPRCPKLGHSCKRSDKKPRRQATSARALDFTRLIEDHYKSDHVRNYPARAGSKNPYHMTKPPVCDTVKFVTTFEQKLFRDPPRPIMPFQSEMKGAYSKKPLPFEGRLVFPPNPYRVCAMRAFGRDEQPPLVPEQPGMMKNLDIYMTTSRADYIPYSVIQQRGIACKDIVTYYDSVGVPRGGKGYGPKKDTKIEPIVKTKKAVYNRKWKKVQNPLQTIPHRAFKSEYSENYQPSTKSEMEAYSNLSTVATFPSISHISPWQNICPPGMYCTETCHIGTGYPIHAVIETTPPKREYKHTIGCKC